MNLGRARHGALTVLLLIGALVGQTAVSTALANGAELAEDVSADVSDPDAAVALTDVSTFPSSGDAVFEPGTPYEERVGYSSVDVEANLLIGLTRPTPLHHSAGVFVQAPEVESTPTPTASATPQPDETPATASDDSSTGATSDDASGSGISSDAASVNSSSERQTSVESGGPDPCLVVTGDTCEGMAPDVLGGIECTDDSACNLIGEMVSNPLGPVDSIGCTDDPACERVRETVEDPMGGFGTTSPCDPHQTGQTCLEYLQPGPCDISFPIHPHVGDLGFPLYQKGVVIGDSAASCPGIPSFFLIVCLEYGVTPLLMPPESSGCMGWPTTVGRVDGFGWGACKPGFWRTWAQIWVRGSVLQDDHSSTVELDVGDCLGPEGVPRP